MTKIIIDGITVELARRSSSGDRRTYMSKTRVYGALEALAPDLNALEPQWVSEPGATCVRTLREKETAVGVEVDDATKLKGKIWRAWRDGTKSIVAERLSTLIEKLIEQGVIELPSAKATFSHKAGCSCGCSPGYILSDRVEIDGWKPADIYLSLDEE